MSLLASLPLCTRTSYAQPFQKNKEHCLTLGYFNMAEDSAWCKLQDVAMFWDFGSIRMIVTGGMTVSTQDTACDHAKTSSRAVRNSSNECSSISIRRSRKMSLEAIYMLYPVEEYTVQLPKKLDGKG